MSELAIWLNELGLSKYLTAFSENEVVFSDIPDLTEEDLKEIGLPVGPRRRLLKAAQALLQESESTADPRDPESVTATAASMDRRPSSEAERRQLTVMFVDLVGSTALSERLDPEEMRDAITGFQNTVAGVVTRFEGNVAKYMGDGVLCYFGWPRAHEDDAERSVRAAIGVIQALEQSDAVAGEELSARAGIATGLVVVGDLVGEGGAQEDAVIGSTPNLAARLQALAEPGQLVIAEATKRLVGELFEFDKLGALSLKGIAAPVNAFVVTGERLVEARFDAQHTGTVAKMIGREQELALLLDRWRQAEGGEGQMVLLIGEAGIGKSRIARGLRNGWRLAKSSCGPFWRPSQNV